MKLKLDNLQINEKQYPIIITKKSRIKRMVLSLKRGAIHISIPWYVPKVVAMAFVHAQKEWITQKSNLLTIETINKDLYKDFKQQAKKVLLPKLKYWSQRMIVHYNKVTIRNQSSVWGSCSSKKNLNFNYKIIHLPEPLLDYLVIHELAHTVHMNHSILFWKLVEKYDQEYKKHRKNLKQYAVHTEVV